MKETTKFNELLCLITKVISECDKTGDADDTCYDGAVNIAFLCCAEAVDAISKLSIYPSPSSSDWIDKNDAIQEIEKRLKQ